MRVARTSGVLRILLACAVVWLAPRAPHAQRGADYRIHDDAAPTFRDGYPELFNTELAKPGAVVVDQFLSVDYGVPRDLTVGANPLPAYVFAPKDGGPAVVPGAGASAR